MPEQLYPVGTKILRWRNLSPVGEVIRASATSVWTLDADGREVRLVAAASAGELVEFGGPGGVRYVVEGARVHQERARLLAADRNRATVQAALDDATQAIEEATVPIVALLHRVVASSGPLDDRLAKVRRIRAASVAALAAVEAEHG